MTSSNLRQANRKLKKRRSKPLLGTFVELEAEARLDEYALIEILEKGFAAISKVENLMSFHNRESALSRLNATRVGVWMELDPWMIAVLECAQALEKSSQGIFNIACGSVLSEWGFLPKLSDSTNTQGLDLSAPTFELEGMRARRLKSVHLDLGGIAKGFAVDKALEAISAFPEVEAGMVNAGGDLRIFGSTESTIAVRVEKSAAAPIFYPLSLQNMALATSSLRPKFSSHVVMPAQMHFQKFCTTSVFAPQAMAADALTKIVAMAVDSAVAKACLKQYSANAICFDEQGRLEKSIG